MYMVPIIRAKPTAPLARRHTTGTALLLLGTLVMLPWFALFGAVGAATALVRGLAALPRTVAELVDHVGDHAHGL